jgi:Flp pilus assembly protein TadG
MRRGRGSEAAVGMVEFAIVLPFLLLVIFGMVDFGRGINANSTVSDAARQGARQMAPDAASADNPFGSVSGACSGTVLVQNAGGSGCLTDAAVLATVKAALAPLTAAVTSYYGTTAANCPAPGTAGQATVCIAPSDSAAAARGPGDTCAAAQAALGHAPVPGELGGRKAEWTTSQYASGRCFLVQVTVRYAFNPWTPVIRAIIGSSLQIASTTSTLAEY